MMSAGVLRGLLHRDDEWGWRIPYAIQWAWPIPIIVGILFAPEVLYTFHFVKPHSIEPITDSTVPSHLGG